MAGLSAPAATVLPAAAAAEGAQARDGAAGAAAPAAADRAGTTAYPRRSSLHRAAASGRYRPSEPLDPPVAPDPAWVAAVAAANAARAAPAPAPRASAARAPTSPRAACLAAARRAERTYGLPEGLMVAIALSESGLHANALNIGGRSHFPEDAATARAMLASAVGRSSVMAGCVQVNAGVHARNGSDWPLDPQRATDWSGERLRRWHDETGSWTTALARWHGGGGAGTRRVLCRVRAKLDVAAPGSPALRDVGCADAARVRRSGATLLEVAEALP